MAIKIYKSQIAPTAESSNVANKAFINPQEAASIGNAWKGMVKSGQELYVKHLDIKTDNEVLEKQKEVMNGTENSKGLTEISTTAGQMNDPDKAGAYYNSEWQRIFDRNSETLSGKMAQRKFKSLMTKQNINDVNSIKQKATGNMISSRRVNELDRIETLKKSIIFGQTEEERQRAVVDLDVLLKSSKTKDIFGKTLTKVNQKTKRDIAFYGYKNVAIANQTKALAEAKKDNRLDLADIDKLKTAFKIGRTTTDNINKDKVSSMESNVAKGIIPDEEEFKKAVSIATQTGDQKTLLKLEKIQKNSSIYAQLKTMSVADIESKINILQNIKSRKGGSLNLEDANNLNVTTKYFEQLDSDLKKDLLKTATERDIVQISEIGFEKLLTPGAKVEDFTASIQTRKANAETAASFYKRPVTYLTNTEATAIKSAFDTATKPAQIINLATELVRGFGDKSDTVFKQLSKDNTFLSHIGGLVLMNDGNPNNNVNLAVEGYLLSKQPDLAAAYKFNKTEPKLITSIAKYRNAFGENLQTLNNTIEVANYIHAANLKNQGKTKEDNFVGSDWEDAFELAAGAKIVTKKLMGMDYLSPDTRMGGFDQTSRMAMVHIPNWIEQGTFPKIEEILKNDPGLVLKASSNGKAALDINGKEFINIFTTENPHFVSVGNGKYKIANGDNPYEFGGDPEYLLNSDGGYFIINLNKIKSEIITGIK